MLSFKHIAQDLGFTSIKEFAGSILGMKSFGLLLFQISFAGLAGFIAFIDKWVYYPSSSVFIMSVLIIADCFLDVAAKFKVEKKIHWSLFNRVIPLLLSRIFLMSMGHHLQTADPGSFSWIPESVFGYFTAQHAISVLQSLVTLNLVKANLLQILGSRMDKSQKQDTTPSKPDQQP